MDNNQTVFTNMEHISSTQSIQTFDFSTLYTKIPLEDLKEKLKRNIEKAFKGGNNQYIRVTQQDAGWCHQKKTNTFSKDEVFAMIDLVVDNSFLSGRYWMSVGMVELYIRVAWREVYYI